jgi:uncharacterized protein YndB with AHSA1/START domain
MGLYVLIGIVALVVALALVVAARPAAFHIERSIAIAAPPENAFARVNDFHEWAAWSPFEKLDPEVKKTFGGEPSGTGATYAWAGNSKAGEGRMTIERSDKPSLIAIKLEFLKPFAATNTATFTFVPTPGGTTATWAMDGQRNFVMKAFSLFIDSDKWLGAEFDSGLTALKALAEGAPTATTAG